MRVTARSANICCCSDARPYANRREWTRRLESLAARQLEIVAALCEDDRDGSTPMTELTSRTGVLSRDKSSNEVWKLPGVTSVVTRSSEESLLPRLAAWEKSEQVAATILFQIESQMQRCPYTLGLGEPNLGAKPALEYDLVVRPAELHALKRSTDDAEVQALCAVHQIVESWLHASSRGSESSPKLSQVVLMRPSTREDDPPSSAPRTALHDLFNKTQRTIR